MAVDALLSRLNHVRPTGKGKYRAQCPVHSSGTGNKSALSICETDSGTILLTCHVCQGGAGEIASAIGLDLSELFPPSMDPLKSGKPMVRPFLTRTVLEALDRDLRLAYVLFSDIAKGRVPLNHNVDRAKDAKERMLRLIQEVGKSA